MSELKAEHEALLAPERQKGGEEKSEEVLNRDVAQSKL